MPNEDNSRTITMEITGSTGITTPFLQLFGKGVELECRVGCSIRDVLCGQLGVEADYLDNRVQTVFLNSKAVDDVDNTVVSDGAVLALSAAMPGLAGATLRKGGHLAAMRSQISHETGATCATGGTGRIILKLFNLLLKELGPHFLARGVRVRGESMEALLRETGDGWWENCQLLALDGQAMNRDQMDGIDWKAIRVLLKINPE